MTGLWANTLFLSVDSALLVFALVKVCCLIKIRPDLAVNEWFVVIHLGILILDMSSFMIAYWPDSTPDEQEKLFVLKQTAYQGLFPLPGLVVYCQPSDVASHGPNPA